jgi:oligoribonuclease NrnB/cAMP/cGMP phosphodiesterase (DHH superfamily)
MDGICSGAIVKMKFPDCKMIGIGYGETFNFDYIKEGEEIFMVDFSLKDRNEMDTLNNMCRLTWIDHHYHAIKDVEANEFRGLLDSRFAACELTWMFLNDEPIPLAIYLLGRYDIWDHKDDRTIPFQYGIQGLDLAVADPRWHAIINGNFASGEILINGRIIRKYMQKQYQKFFESNGIICTLDEHSCFAFNAFVMDSLMFMEIPNKREYDILAGFSINIDSAKVRYSLRAGNGLVDVGEVAQKYGGGGHQAAAGFYHDDIIFNI